jgi:hypothetical protein
MCDFFVPFAHSRLMNCTAAMNWSRNISFTLRAGAGGADSSRLRPSCSGGSTFGTTGAMDSACNRHEGEHLARNGLLSRAQAKGIALRYTYFTMPFVLCRMAAGDDREIERSLASA